MQWISKDWTEYEVLDATDGFRLESWCGKILVRPDPQVIWTTPQADPRWKRFDAKYLRSNTGGGRWDIRSLPESWLLRYKDYLTFNVKPMNFKHTGVFPEQAANWDQHGGYSRLPGDPDAPGYTYPSVPDAHHQRYPTPHNLSIHQKSKS